MNYVLIIHEVEDYQKWHKIFVKATSLRKKAGEISYQILKYENESKKIVHLSNWSSLDDAKLFFESPQLVQIRQEAGVILPKFIYLKELENGVL